MLEDGKLGLIVENTEKGIYEGMKKALTQPESFNEYAQELNIYKMPFTLENSVQSIIKIIDELYESDKDIYITSSVKQLIEISYKDAGKRSGVQYLAGLLGIDRKDIAAFGDADNDIDMIQFAGYGVVMGNATEHLKSIADYVTKSNDEDGVAYAIENILLN